MSSKFNRNNVFQSSFDNRKGYNDFSDRGRGNSYRGQSSDIDGGYASGNRYPKQWPRRSTRVPEGHWRGGRNGRRPRGGGGHRPLPDDDVDMRGKGGTFRHETFYRNTRHSHMAGRRPKTNMQRMKINNLGWFKIIIKDSINYDRQKLIGAICGDVEDSFTPVLLNQENNNVVFYLEDNGEAVRAILKLSRRIAMPDGRRLVISGNHSTPPNIPLSNSQLNIVKQVMSERYSVEMTRLDLNNFHNDQRLVSQSIFCPLYRVPNLSKVVEIIVSNIPGVSEIDLSHNKINNVESLQQLFTSCKNLTRLSLQKNNISHIEAFDKLSSTSLVDLYLAGNPVCDKFKEIESYTSAVRKQFPKVMFLDGRELPKPIGFEVEDEPSHLPESKSSYFCDENAKAIALKFLEQYFQFFDTADRSVLKAAYTEDALLSVTALFPETGPGAWLSNKYMKESRNLMKVNSSEQRVRQLFRGRKKIDDILSSLPQCTHDPNSFVIDIPLVSPQLMQVMVRGVFKQVADRKPPIRFFTRSLVIVPEGSGFCICNEELFVTTATVEQTAVAFKSVPTAATNTTSQVPPAPASTPEPVLTTQQMDLVKQFSQDSGMLPQYCKDCLEQRNWDYAKAGELFVRLNDEKQIPSHYFQAPHHVT